MKNLLLITFVSLVTLSAAVAQNVNHQVATQSNTEVNPNAPKASWNLTVNDLGDIPQSIPKEAQFILTNTGKEPLIIQSAKASCGCTNTKFSQEPVLPGKSTTIAATYNAAAPGQFSKSITVITNASPNPVILSIKGNVVAKQQ